MKDKKQNERSANYFSWIFFAIAICVVVIQMINPKPVLNYVALASMIIAVQFSTTRVLLKYGCQR